MPRTRLAHSVGFLAACCILGSATYASDPDSILSPNFPARAMRVLVIDEESKAPLADVKVSAAWLTRSAMLVARAAPAPELGAVCRPAHAEKFAADTQTDGVARVEIPAGAIDSGSLRVQRDGYVAASVSWRCEAGARWIEPPAEYRLELQRAATVGGVVRDERGKAIPGVAVKITHRGGRQGAMAQPGEPNRMVHAELRTDEEGRWSFAGVPAVKPAPYELQLTFAHKDYSQWHMECHDSHPPWDELTAARWAFVLKDDRIARATVRGRVLKPDGTPAADAHVWTGQSPRGMVCGTPSSRLEEQRQAKTDAEGRFVFEDASPSDPGSYYDGMPAPTAMMLNVSASGFVQERLEVPVLANAEETEIQLKPARTLRVRFVDASGAPLADVRTTKPQVEHIPVLLPGPRSDADGWVELRDVPAQDFKIDASKPGYLSSEVRSSSLAKGVVIMKAAVYYRGRVLDDATGEPIPKFVIQAAGKRVWEAETTTWDAERISGRAGQFELTFDEEATEYWIEAHADRYLSSRVQLPRDEREVELRLTRTEPQPRSVRTPEGGPAVGARWTVLSPVGNSNWMLSFQNGALVRDPSGLPSEGHDAFDGFEQTSGPDGRVQPKFRRANDLAYVWHESGWAVLTGDELRSNEDTILKRWSQVDGVLSRNGRPVANQVILVENSVPRGTSGPLHFQEQLETLTDDQGRFSFPRLMAGSARLGPAADVKQNFPAMRYSVTARLRQGQVAQVSLGGGRTVRARIPLIADLNPPMIAEFAHPLIAVLHRPQLNRPDEVVEAGADAVMKWWSESPESAAWRMQPNSFRAAANPDGMVEFDDVPSGEYTLGAQYHGRGGAEAQVAHDFTVPGAGSDMDVIDLGRLQALVPVKLAAGQPAPACEVVLRDGSKLRLDDLRGKIVLVDFWATWCGPCRESFARLRALHDLFKPDSRFETLGISLDESRRAWEKLVDKESLPGRQGILTTDARKPTMGAWGVRGVPAVFVIGPDGRLLTGLIDLSKAEQAIREALAPDGAARRPE